VIKADILLRRLEAAGETDPARWNAARAYLLTANQVAQDDPMVLMAWYDSFPMQRRKPSKTARDGLARAFALAPEVPELRARYALDLAEQGRFDDAIKVAQTLAFDPHGGKQGQALLSRIESMRDIGQAAQSPAPASGTTGVSAKPNR
jgi:predicted Zn-dependent protease